MNDAATTPRHKSTSGARAFPTLWRIALAEAIAWRSELVIWLLSTNTAVVMLLLWTAVAAEQPIGAYGSAEFAAYFLAMLVVRLLTGAWVVWQMNTEIREGSLSTRLLRPIHPFWSYAAENLGAWPLRVLILLPVMAVFWFWLGPSYLAQDPLLLALFPVALVGGWAVFFTSMLCIGSLAFFWHRTMSLFEVWLAGFVALSGYLAPLSLFPVPVQRAAEFLPFASILSFPVRLVLGDLDRSEAVRALGIQWGWAAVTLAVALLLFQRGVRRYEAFGG